MNRILDFLVESFVSAFGITHPKPEQQRIVRVVLGGALLLVICGVLGVVAFFWIQLH